MNAILNRVSMFNVQKLNSPDNRQMNDAPKASYNKMSLVSLRNKQMNAVKDTVSFSSTSPVRYEPIVWW